MSLRKTAPYDPNWKAGTPVVITDPWTGNKHTVYPSAPIETYPRGYFGDSLSARLPFFSPQEQMEYWQWQEELCLRNQALETKSYYRVKKSDFLKDVERQEREKQMAGIREKIAALQAQMTPK